MSNDDKCLDIDIKWVGNASVAAFHEVVTVSFAADQRVTTNELQSAINDAALDAIEKGIAQAKRDKEIEKLSSDTGLDIRKMYEFYEVTDYPSLLIELNNHVKQLITQVPDKPQGSGRTPREG